MVTDHDMRRYSRNLAVLSETSLNERRVKRYKEMSRRANSSWAPRTQRRLEGARAATAAVVAASTTTAGAASASAAAATAGAGATSVTTVVSRCLCRGSALIATPLHMFTYSSARARVVIVVVATSSTFTRVAGSGTLAGVVTTVATEPTLATNKHCRSGSRLRRNSLRDSLRPMSAQRIRIDVGRITYAISCRSRACRERNGKESKNKSLLGEHLD